MPFMQLMYERAERAARQPQKTSEQEREKAVERDASEMNLLRNAFTYAPNHPFAAHA